MALTVVAQAYVALSRASSPDGLQVVGFDEDVVLANPTALAFHDALSATNPQEVSILHRHKKFGFSMMPFMGLKSSQHRGHRLTRTRLWSL